MKTALITGSSRGIGFGIAKQLAKSGFRIILNGQRDLESIKDAIEEISKITEVIYIQASIASEADRENLLKTSIEKFGLPNLLVNNAGVASKQRCDILDLEIKNYDYLMDINLKGTFFLTQSYAKEVLKKKEIDKDFEAMIITVSSISADVASTNRAEYCLAKSALSMMTKLYAIRLAEHDIPVYELRPGIIKTDMTNIVSGKYDKLIEEGLCLTKRWGYPEDIGKAVSCIAQRNFLYSTGQVFNVDGGMMIPRL